MWQLLTGIRIIIIIRGLETLNKELYSHSLYCHATYSDPASYFVTEKDFTWAAYFGALEYFDKE